MIRALTTLLILSTIFWQVIYAQNGYSTRGHKHYYHANYEPRGRPDKSRPRIGRDVHLVKDIDVPDSSSLHCTLSKSGAKFICPSLEDSSVRIECNAVSDMSVLGHANYELFGIALHPTKQVLKRDLDQVHFHLYPKLLNSTNTWLPSSTKHNGVPRHLSLYHSRSLKYHHGILIDDPKCFKSLIKMIKSVNVFGIVKDKESNERIKLVGDIRITN